MTLSEIQRKYKCNYAAAAVAKEVAAELEAQLAHERRKYEGLDAQLEQKNTALDLAILCGEACGMDSAYPEAFESLKKAKENERYTHPDQHWSNQLRNNPTNLQTIGD